MWNLSITEACHKQKSFMVSIKRISHLLKRMELFPVSCNFILTNFTVLCNSFEKYQTIKILLVPRKLK